MDDEIVNVSVIITNPSNQAQFLLTKQKRPTKFYNPEYDAYEDSDLWDLPSARLKPLANNQLSSRKIHIEVEGSSSSEEIRILGMFDFDSAIDEIYGQVAFENTIDVRWKFLKIVEEPEFGPRCSYKYIYIAAESEISDQKSEDICKWMNTEDCMDKLLDVKTHDDRIGPLVCLSLLNKSMPSSKLDIPPTLRYQEYPPGVKLIPMASRTAKPFLTTNLVLFFPEIGCNNSREDHFVVSGDAIIVDPGCKSSLHKELEQIVAALPKKLVVFVTHHHNDHVDGLAVIKKCNPNAILLAHENTFRRIRKGDWSLRYVSVSGSEEICIGGQCLRLVSAPGHTDGHLALLHVSTNTLIVGDHCVGQGSSLLDINSGGNMSDYFRTTYKFIDLSPHILIPMHGRVILWPTHALCGYLSNRRNRESTILKAIEGGSKTLFDIVSRVYIDVDHRLWFHASSNVRLHVEHLAEQNKLPKEFSVQIFESSCGLGFVSHWVFSYLCNRVSRKLNRLQISQVIGVGAVITAIAIFVSIRE